jgi:hypothetical protein
VARLDFDDLVGQDGDIVHVMVTDTALDRLNARLSGSQEPSGAEGPPPDVPVGSGEDAGTQARGQS